MTKEKTLNDYLHSLPKPLLASITDEKEGNGIVSVSQVISKAHAMLTEPARILSIYDALSEVSRTIFRFLIYQGGAGADPLRIASATGLASAKEIEGEIEGLQSRLLICAIKSTPCRYFVFREVRTVLLPLLLNRWGSTLKCREVKSLEAGNGDGFLFYRDFMVFLSKLYSLGLRKTRGGSFNRKQLGEWLGLFGRNDNSAPEEGMPERMKLMLRVATEMELVFESDSELALSEEGLEYLDKSSQEQATLLYSKIVEMYNSDKIFILLQTCLQLSAVYFTKDDLQKFIADNGEFLKLMQTVGFIDDGCRVTTVGKALYEKQPLMPDYAESLTVLPNFEVIAPRILRPSIMKSLFVCCEEISSDSFITFKLTKESLYSGYEMGVEPHVFIETLEKATKGALPQNIKFSILEWSASWGAVSFEMRFILRVKKEDIYRKIREFLTSSNYSFEDMPNFGFSICASDYKELFDVLVKLGYNPKPYSGLPEGAKGRSRLLPFASGRNKTRKRRAPDFNDSPDEEFLLPSTSDRLFSTTRTAGSGKYGGRMENLPFNELVHIVNYAILMEFGIDLAFKSGSEIRLLPRELRLYLSAPKVVGLCPHSGKNIEVAIEDIHSIRVRE